MKKSLIGVVFALATQSAVAADYCIALRGNGELMPAHWGALASTVEVYGTPAFVRDM